MPKNGPYLQTDDNLPATSIFGRPKRTCYPALQSIQPARKHLLESLLRLLLDCEVLWLHRHRLGRNSSVVGVDQLLLINDGGLDLALRLDGPRSDPQVASITAPTSYRVGSLGQMISDPNDPLV